MNTTRAAHAILDDLRRERADLARYEAQAQGAQKDWPPTAGGARERAQHTRSRIRDLERELGETAS